MTKSLGPLLEVARIQSEINRLFDNLLDLHGEEGEAGSWMPNADIRETAEHVLVEVELSGVARDSVEISINSGNLLIRGMKAAPEAPTGASVRAGERAFGPFRRSIQLGVPVNTRRAEALLIDGLLRISFPKVPNRRGEDVVIQVQSE